MELGKSESVLSKVRFELGKDNKKEALIEKKVGGV